MALTKPRQVGSPSEALAEFCDAVGPKAVAAFADISVSTLYNLLNPDLTGDISYARAAQWTDHFKVPALAEHMAHLAGGTFVPDVTVDAAATDMAALCDLVSKSSDAIGEFAKARGDGEWTVSEARAVRRELRELLVSIHAADRRLAAIEAGTVP